MTEMLQRNVLVPTLITPPGGSGWDEPSINGIGRGDLHQ